MKAARYGCAGVVLSNHGGRQLDTARSGIEILPEVVSSLRSAGVKVGAGGPSKGEFAVFVDGGVRRGSDIFKALALGATGVGIGRPVLYSLASFGEDGVARMVQLLKDELIMVMRLNGTPTIKDITGDHVDASSLSNHGNAAMIKDELFLGVYQPHRTSL